MTTRSAAALIALAALMAGCDKHEQAAWSGYAEGDYVYIAAPVSGALQALSVRRGDAVQRGAALFTLDAEDERAARAEAASRLRAAEAQASDTEKGRRADEIAMAKSQLDEARAQATFAARELERQQALVAQGFVSASRLDDARTASHAAQARVGELEAALRVARLPAREDERNAARATAEAARFALQQSSWREQQMQQAAPADGRIADTFFRIGEWINAGQPVVALLPPGNTRARFFVPESEVGALAPGQPVTIHCDGCGAPIAARIDFIATGPEYTPPVIYSNAQRARLVFMVEARPDPKDGERLKPGQPLDVRRAAAPSPQS